jgi:hypothetical protein
LGISERCNTMSTEYHDPLWAKGSLPLRRRRIGWLGWLVPLAVLSPVVPIGPYAVGVVDALVVLWAALALYRGNVPPLRPSPILAYVLLFFLGWVFATCNGLRFGINLQAADFIILYRLGFCFAAWWLGYQSSDSMYRITTSRITLVLVAAVAAVVVAYGLLPYPYRVKLMSFLSADDRDLTLTCYLDRFPGIGTNANIYAFFPLCLLIFSFRSFMRSRAKVIVPALCLIIVLGAGSRKTLAFTVAAVAIMFLIPAHGQRIPQGYHHVQAIMRPRNRILVALAILVMGLLAAELVSRSLVSDRALNKLAHQNSTEDVDYRVRKWGVGMRRVMLAPFLGIPEPRGDERHNLEYYLRMTQPHNEFIQIWMWYGLLGLLAHVYLLAVMLTCAVKHRMGPAWCLFYVAVIVQMMVDTAFKDYQFSALFFMVAGHNWRVMERQDTLAATGPDAPSGEDLSLGGDEQ